MNKFLMRIVRAIQRTSIAEASKKSPLLKHVSNKHLAPANALVRLGTAYGGWIIPADAGLNGDSVCYLAGAGEDISFDCALAQRFHCTVRVIDPTPRAIEHFRLLKEAVGSGQCFPINNSTTDFYNITHLDLARISFLPIGLADRDVNLKFFLPKNPVHVSCSTLNLQKTEEFFTAQCHCLATIMSQQGDSRIDLLKMDIEGAEYMVIRDIIASGLLPRLLLIEFDEAHTPLDGDAHLRIQESISLLTHAGMRCVALDGVNATFMRTKEQPA